MAEAARVALGGSADRNGAPAVAEAMVRLHNVIVRDSRLDSGIHLLSKAYWPQDLATGLRQILDAD